MKKLLTAFAVTAMAIAGATVVSLASNNHAYANPNADACIKTPGGINVNNQNANVDINLDNGCGRHKFVMKAWYAPSADGTPHEKQRIFARSEELTMTPQDATKHLNVKMLPQGCFYQVDLVDITGGEEGDKNPIVRAVTGGNRDCTPTPVYACNNIDATQGADRRVTLNNFQVTAQNATLSRVMITWGDGSNTQVTGTANGATHQYTADGNYSIQAVAYFNITGKNGEPNEKAAPVTPGCTEQVSFTTPTPGNQQVCDLSTGKIVTIPEGKYDTSKYGPTNSEKCNPTTTVTSTPPADTPPTELVKTGPASTAALFLIVTAAAIGVRQYVLRRRG